MMIIETRNPATEQIIKTYDLFNETQLIESIDKTYAAYQAWKKKSYAERKALMLKLAKLLDQKKTVYAKLIAEEMGKPVTAGHVEIEKCVWVCQHYAKHAEHYLKAESIQTDLQKSYVCYQPLGIVFGIMPWNFPFWQVFRYAVPTIMAGNATLLKHAPISTGAALAMEALFLEAGFPKHLFTTVLIDEDMAKFVIAHPHIAAVTLTGSERAGSSVAATAGQYLKRIVLELGGNDPYLVLADADLTYAAKCLVTSRLNNAGQSCIAAKRFIVIESVVDEFVEQVKLQMNRYNLGDPLNPKTTMGPIARADLREKLHQQVLATQQQGAQILVGGTIPHQTGYYYPPTLITQVKPGMTAFEDELFGPVISIIPVQNEHEAILLANQSQFGLGGGVFTQDLQRGEHIARFDIETGTCFVNQFVSSDPRLPFGGIKKSGFGRELSRQGILEFVNVKTIGIGC